MDAVVFFIIMGPTHTGVIVPKNLQDGEMNQMTLYRIQNQYSKLEYRRSASCPVRPDRQTITGLPVADNVIAEGGGLRHATS